MRPDIGFEKPYAGICQGCPLSPFLFVILMTVLIHDARANLSQQVGATQAEKLLYADDTLLLGVSAVHVAEFASAVSRVGQNYGMQLPVHWGKTQALLV